MGKFAQIRDDPVLPLYIAEPKDQNGKYPCVILFMHRPGMDKSQQKVCDDLAKAGYFAVGADTYRDGELDQDSYTDQTIFEDFEFVLNYVKNHPNVDNQRIGTIGFCMGGRHVYLATARYSEIKASVSYYGFPTRGQTPNDTPIDLVSQFNVPVCAIFGEEDHLIPMENVRMFEEVLTSGSSNHSVVVCKDVGHGFLNPNSKNYKQDAATTAWLKTLEHFRKYL